MPPAKAHVTKLAVRKAAKMSSLSKAPRATKNPSDEAVEHGNSKDGEEGASDGDVDEGA